MVKVKIIKAHYPEEEKYVGGIYESLCVDYDTHKEYLVQIASNHLRTYMDTDVEELFDNPDYGKEVNKDINMKNIMNGLGIDIGDIVRVNETHVMCNEKYDLVTLDNKYNSTIPGLILGMVSGKYGYQVFSLNCVVRGKENVKVPVSYI